MTDLRKAAEELIEAWDWDCSEPRNTVLRDLIEDIRQALAQPEQDYERGFIDGMQKQMQSTVEKAVNAMTKREWVGLTEEEKDGFWKADQMSGEEWDELFAEVEAKLKEKNT